MIPAVVEPAVDRDRVLWGDREMRKFGFFVSQSRTWHDRVRDRRVVDDADAGQVRLDNGEVFHKVSVALRARLSAFSFV